MEMIINAKTVKALRSQRLWSQEELAIACDVGLRTIQRVEGEGQASPQTVKALAAVFEVDSAELLERKAGSRAYLNVQLGYVTISVLILIALALTCMLNMQSLRPKEFLIAICVLAIVTSMFATLTTQVNDRKVKWYLGIGLIHKTVDLSEIDAHITVRNKAWWGFGIRLIQNGWLYNVSGLRAVELKLSNGKVVRIGSDEPEAFNQAIHDARARLPDQTENG